MSGRRAVFLTTRRELRERLRSRAFQVSTALLLLLVAGVAVISIVTSDGADELRLGVVGEQARSVGEATQAREAAFDLDVELVDQPSEEAARAAVRDGDLDLGLVEGRLLAGADPYQRALDAVQSAARTIRLRERLRAEGIGGEEARRILAVPPLAVREVAGTGESGQGLAFVGSLLLYIAIFTAGLQVATGVVEEKSSRVVELVLSAIRPAQLLVGKVLGIGIVGLLQLVLVVGLGLAVALGSGEIDLPASTVSTAALVVVYFLLGYAFYASAFAAAGALVSRQEDTQTTTAPMTVALITSYLVSLVVVEEPDSGLATACSLLPPVAPLVVPARAAQDALPALELVLSLGAMALGTLALVLLAASIYERSVLRMGAPLKLSQALRLARPR